MMCSKDVYVIVLGEGREREWERDSVCVCVIVCDWRQNNDEKIKKRFHYVSMYINFKDSEYDWLVLSGCVCNREGEKGMGRMTDWKRGLDCTLKIL